MYMEQLNKMPFVVISRSTLFIIV